jgi:hypothetical protein
VVGVLVVLRKLNVKLMVGLITYWKMMMIKRGAL